MCIEFSGKLVSAEQFLISFNIFNFIFYSAVGEFSGQYNVISVLKEHVDFVRCLVFKENFSDSVC